MKKIVRAYNVRVYGVLINDNNEVLLSKESKKELHFTKFPGGGHELGEGLRDCLQREFMEELGIKIEILRHLYTTDFFQLSAFNDEEQLISIYYLVKSESSNNIESGLRSIDPESDSTDHFVWRSLGELKGEELTYPIDRHVAKLLLKNP